MSITRRSCIFIVLIISVTLSGRTESGSLTLEKIFRDMEYKAESFGPFRWAEKGSTFSLLKPSPGDKDVNELLNTDPRTGKTRVLVSASNLVPPGGKDPLKIEDYSVSPDGKTILIFTDAEYVWRTKSRGNYWIYRPKSKKFRQLGKGLPGSSLMFAKFAPDSSRIAYVSERNIYTEDVLSGKISRLTDTGSPSIINGTFDWVYEEEFHMKDGFRWSPDGKNIAFWQFDISGVRDFHLIDNISELYSKVIPIQYPKAGETNSSCRTGIVNVLTMETQWVGFEGDPRDHYIPRMEWAKSDNEVIIQRMNRAQNRNRIWIYNISSRSLVNIHTEEDDAWLEVEAEVFWYDDGKYFLWITESDGWKHIYRISRDGKDKKLITPGEFDVISLLRVDRNRQKVYFTASPENPAQRYLYSADLNGEGGIKRITPENFSGTNRYIISADCRYAVHSFSTFLSPESTDLISLPDHRRIRTLEDNAALRKKLSTLNFGETEFFRVAAEDGLMLDGWMIKPPDFDKNNIYPALFYVYGEPWGQTVTDAYRGDSTLWHMLLAQKGYVILSVDNRGTPSPRGRVFRKSVYKKLGIITAKDQADAATAVCVRFPFIDRDRIGVWGWSGGGSMTLNLLFQYPEIYKAGISVAPVADMRYYDSIYQERYMGMPTENIEGYKSGSPITHAGKLAGNLLVIHGTGDDNVHYQNTEALIDKLIEHNKPFSMMSYPNRRHSIREGKNTRLHLYTLMTSFLLDNLSP